ncbi:hypothetical protein D3C86_1465800 [compost metagenome]
MLGRHRIGGLSAATGNLRPDGVGQQAVFFVEVLEQRIFALDRVAADPGQRRGLAYLQAFDPTLCRSSINGRIGDLNARFALVAVGHLLPDPDHLHGHEVLVDAPAIRAADGVVLHTCQQLGVR